MAGYRKTTKKSVICDVTSNSDLHILNGASAEFAVPCFYVIKPGVKSGCKVGQPELEPIHLREEGYANPVIAIDDVPDGLSWLAWIDETDDHIVRMVFHAQCPGAVDEAIGRKVSVLITRQTLDKGPRTDIVFRGRLTVQPSPLPA
jgi:hypothetical protein